MVSHCPLCIVHFWVQQQRCWLVTYKAKLFRFSRKGEDMCILAGITMLQRKSQFLRRTWATISQNIKFVENGEVNPIIAFLFYEIFRFYQDITVNAIC